MNRMVPRARIPRPKTDPEEGEIANQTTDSDKYDSSTETIANELCKECEEKNQQNSENN